MNLMFWKKKTAPEDGVDNQQEDSDGDAAPENASDDELAGDPERQGLIARLKSKFTALFSRAKKSDTAKDDEAEELGGKSGDEPDDEQRGDPPNESATATEEAPVKPGLIARIKSQLSGLLGRFRKPAQKASDTKERDQPAGNSTEEAKAEPKKPGLIERLKPVLASLGSKLLSSVSRLFALLSEYMIYWLSALAVILLVGLIYVARDIIFPPLVRKTTSSDPAKYVKPVPASAPEAAPTLEPDPNASPQAAAEIFQKKSEEAKAKAEALIKEAEELQKKSEEAKARAEALKKKEEEERAQAEALRKKQEEERASRYRNQSGSSGQQTTGGTKVMPGSNEWTAGSKDPKATAKTLKEAIEAMNAESSGNISRPAKPPGNP